MAKINYNTSEKVDLRIYKTKEALKKALIDLLITNSIEKITINQICQKASVNRITFYNHFVDIYDLFNCIIKDEKIKLKDNLFNELKGSDVKNDLLKSIMKIVSTCIDECYTHKDLILSIVNFDGNSIVEYIVRNAIEDSVYEIIDYVNLSKYTDQPIRLISCYITGGICSLIFYWLSNDNEYSKDVLLSFIQSLIESSIKDYLNLQ